MSRDETPPNPPPAGPPVPVEGATASDVGTRKPGDTDDIGSTDTMRAATGGLAGTSR